MKTCTRAKRSLEKRLRFESLENRLLLSGTTTSTSWAGYAVTAGAGTVTAVSGAWKVPTVKSSSSYATMSTWVGIDGFNTSTVQQIGTLVTATSNGSVTYSAWYQMYKYGIKQINLAIHARDSITASVNYAGSGKFKVTLNNLTTGKSFSTTQSAYPGWKCSTAEWIVERMEGNGQFSPLAKFGTETFTSCSVIIGSNQMNIGQANHYNITMASSGTTLATTGSLSNSGHFSSFTVTYKASGKTTTASASSTALAAAPFVSDNVALTTLDEGTATAVASADTVSVGFASGTVSYAWDQGLATFKLTDLVKEDSANLLAKKVHDATATDSVFASISEGNLLDINVL